MRDLTVEEVGHVYGAGGRGHKAPKRNNKCKPSRGGGSSGSGGRGGSGSGGRHKGGSS